VEAFASSLVSTGRSQTGYAIAWRRAEAAATESIDEGLSRAPAFEGMGVATLGRHLAPLTPVFVANSMPVRDVEYFWPANERPHRFYFNRGANGIDGTLSTALGVAHGN